MTFGEAMGYCDEDPMMRSAFGSTNPRLGSFPHTILPFGVEALRVIADVTGAVAGIWGEEPLCVESGQPFLAPAQGMAPNQLRLWSLPENQEQLFRYVSRGTDASKFTMLVDCQSPLAVLARMHQELGGRNLSDYYYYVEQAAEWLPELGWAWIPLDEAVAPSSIFAVAKGRAGWVKDVDHRLRGVVPLAKLRRNGDMLAWQALETD